MDKAFDFSLLPKNISGTVPKTTYTHSVIEKPLCSNLQKVHYFLFPQIHW